MHILDINRTFAVVLCLCPASSSLGAIELGNESVAVRIDTDAKGNISGIIDIATRRNFVAPGGPPVPLYAVTLTDEQGQRTTVRSASADRVEVRKMAAGSATMTFSHAQAGLSVRVRVRVPSEGSLSYWRLDVDNDSPRAITRVDFPGFAVPQVLGEYPDKTCVLFPQATNSHLYWNLAEELKFARQSCVKLKKEWPLVLNCRPATVPDVVQLMACYDDTAGLYVATHDSRAHVKDYSIVGLDDDRMRMQIVHRRPWFFGEDFDMGYETAIGVFHGDWTAAADMYRDWAETQPWCAQGKVKDREDVPEWVKAHPIYIRYLLNHPKYEGKKTWSPRFDWRDIPDALDHFEYPDLLPGAIVHFVGYSKAGGWAGYYNERWPAWMGDDKFAGLVKAVAQRGMHPTIEPFGWHLYTKDKDRPNYNLGKQPFFPDLLDKHLCRTTKAGLSATAGWRNIVCIRSEYGRNVFPGDTSKTVPWGMDAVQIMETSLVRKMHCFAPHHGHPPGAGRWVYEDAFEVFRRTREIGKKLNPEFALDKEDTAEFLIPVLDTVYLRNAKLETMRWNGRPRLYKNNVPLFDYIYHEYIRFIGGFSGNEPGTARYTAGLAVVLGHITGPLYGGYPGHACYEAAKGGAWEIVRQGQRACRFYARGFLVFGRTLPSSGIGFGEIEQPAQNLIVRQGPNKWGQRSFLTPRVVDSAHLSPSGNVGLCFVNVCDEPVTFELDLSKYLAYMISPNILATIRHNGDIVKQTEVDLKENPCIPNLNVQPRALLFIVLEANDT